MTLVRAVIWLLALALLTLGGALAYLPTFLASHKDVLEAAASRALGQPVRIGGDVDLAWSIAPTLTLESVRIGADGPTRGGLSAEAEQMEAQIDLGALLERRIRVSRVLIRGADLDLDIGPDGPPFPVRPQGGEAGPSVEIDSLQVLDSKVQIRPSKGNTQRLGIERLDLEGLGGPHLSLEGRLEYHQTPVSIRADADPLHDGTSLVLPFKIRIEVSGAVLDASGGWSGRPSGTELQASVGLTGDDLAALQGLIVVARLPEGPFRIAFEISRSGQGLRLEQIQATLNVAPPFGPLAVTGGEADIGPDSALQLALAGSRGRSPATMKLDLAGARGTDDKAPRRLDITAELGQSGLSGKLGLAFGEQRPRLTGDLSLTKVDLRGPAGPDETTAGDSRPQTWMDKPLPVDVLNAFDANLNLSADLVETGRLTIRGPKARLLVDEGTLRLDDLSVPLPGLPLTGQASLNPRQSPPTLDLALDARRIEIPEALSFLPSPPAIQGKVERVSLRAKAKGDTAKALLESLSGELSAATARLEPTRETSRSDTEIRLAEPHLSTAPGKPVRLKTGLVLDQQPYDLELEGGTLAELLSQEQPWPRIGLRVRGQSQTDRIDIHGTLGPLHALLTATGLQVDLSGEREGIEVSARGELARLDGLRGSRLDINASAESLAQIGELAGIELAGIELAGIELADHRPISLSARLEGSDRRIDLSDLEAASGDNNLQGAIKIALQPSIRVDATLDSQVLDLTPYFGPGPTTEGPQTWLDAQPPQALKTIDGSLRLSAGHLHLTDYGLDQAELDATLDSGHLHLLLSAGARRVDVELDLRPQGDAWKLDFTYKGKLDTAWLAETKDTKDLSRLPATVDVHLTGVGRTFQDMLGAAGGHAELVLGAGRLDKKANVLPFGRILLSVLGALNPLDQGAQLNNIQCAVMQFNVADGIATSTKGLALQTPTINAIGSGAVNLRTQEIQLRFKITKRKGFGISLLGIADKFLHVKGTLHEPKVAINPTGLLIQGGAAWATSGLSLLVEQLASRLTARGNPCDTVLHRGQ